MYAGAGGDAELSDAVADEIGEIVAAVAEFERAALDQARGKHVRTDQRFLRGRGAALQRGADHQTDPTERSNTLTLRERRRLLEIARGSPLQVNRKLPHRVKADRERIVAHTA